MRKRLSRVTIGVLAGLLASMAVASSAGAAYKTGTYKGKTEQGYTFKFKAKKLGVKDFKLEVEAGCEDGSVELYTATGAQAPTSDKGKFSAQFLGEDGFVVVTGKVKGKRANGKIEAEGRNADEFLCTGETKWDAKRKKG